MGIQRWSGQFTSHLLELRIMALESIELLRGAVLQDGFRKLV